MENMNPNCQLAPGGGAADTVGFGASPFTKEEQQRVSYLLNQNLTKDEVSFRAGPGGSKVSYIEANRQIDLAATIFGYDGWSSSIKDLKMDMLAEVREKRFTCCYTAIVRVTLKNGAYHEDVGSGTAENMVSKPQAVEKAQKEAVTDARKRALRVFGKKLGNSVYDKAFVKQVRNGKAQAEGDAEIMLQCGPYNKSRGAPIPNPSSNAHPLSVRPLGGEPDAKAAARPSSSPVTQVLNSTSASKPTASSEPSPASARNQGPGMTRQPVQQQAGPEAKRPRLGSAEVTPRQHAQAHSTSAERQCRPPVDAEDLLADVNLDDFCEPEPDNADGVVDEFGAPIPVEALDDNIYGDIPSQALAQIDMPASCTPK